MDYPARCILRPTAPCGTYVRVSTDEQSKNGYSIPDQIRELTRHAEHG